jgi:predicted O-methyltransferase YrrM
MSDPSKLDHVALAAYTAGLFAEEDRTLVELREEMRRREMPEIQISPEEGRLLQLLVATIGARSILEIGTLGGYSAIWMARALPQNGRLITLELNEAHAEVARAFARRAGLQDVIEVRVGAALDSLRVIGREGRLFDACFIDADKKNYPAYLEAALRLVRPGGLILGDNTFLDGRILRHDADDDADAAAVREFNRRIAGDPRLLSVIVPIRDGLSVSLVRGP